MPKLLSKRTRLFGPAEVVEVAAEIPIGGAPRSRQLGFSMEPQQQTNWCWAAVSTSVARFFEAATQWRQCKLVNQLLRQTSCCQNGSTSNCDQPWRLEHGLQEVGHDRGNASGSLSFEAIRQEIDSNRPIGCYVQWNGGGVGHFVVIEGYREQGAIRRVHIEDSFYGPSNYDYDDFRLRYQNAGGSWQWTYFTRM